MNIELCTIFRWFKVNKLSLNIHKTNYMIFGRSTKFFSETHKIIIDSTEINRVKETKFLGVILDEKLKWNAHIKQIERKVSKGIGMMYQSTGRLDLRSLLTLYNSIIFPYLYYCVEVWGNKYSTRLCKLEKLQKQAIRVINKLKNKDSTNSAFLKNNILKLKELIKLKTCTFVYKANRNLLLPSFNGLFKNVNQIHTHHTRNNQNLYFNKCKTFLNGMSPCIRGVRTS